MKTYLLLLILAAGLFGCKNDNVNDDPKPAPSVGFNFTTGDGFAPDTIQFTNKSVNADDYLWDFGDGDTSTAANPLHIFQSSGSYNVKLTGTNTVGSAFSLQLVSVEPDTELTSARNYVLAEGVFTNIFTIANKALSGCSGQILNSCAVITNDTLSAPKVVTVDFGISNCTGPDQKFRRGKIIVRYSGQYPDSGAVHQVYFDNFYENNNLVQGAISITNNTSALSTLIQSLTLNTKILLANSNDSIVWNATRTITSTPSTCNSDTYQITGMTSGNTIRGRAFTSSITTTIQKQISCTAIVEGKITLTPSGKATRTIDFGTGTCDNIVTVKLNNHDYQISAY